MAFDGAFLHKTVTELQTAENTFVDKIYQPSKDELVFLLRKSGFCKKLLINVRPGTARIQFTETKYENPAARYVLHAYTQISFIGAAFKGEPARV